MKSLLVMKLFLFSLLFVFSVTLESSATPITYRAVAARADKFAQSAGGHAFVFSGIPGAFVFDPSGQFIQDSLRWTLKGTITNGSSVFDVSLVYENIMNYAQAVAADPMSPKKELIDTAYIPVGPVDPTSWLFANTISGTIKGISGAYTGLVLDISKFGPAAQLGYGASGKNKRFGLSNWFYAIAQNGYQFNLPQSMTGDVNIRLKPVPEPSTLLLLGLGSLAAGAVRKRKSN